MSSTAELLGQPKASNLPLPGALVMKTPHQQGRGVLEVCLEKVSHHCCPSRGQISCRSESKLEGHACLSSVAQ